MVTSTRTEVKTWADTASLIHVSHSELVQLETIRFHFADTVKTITRSVTLRKKQADTTAAASLALNSERVHETTKSTPSPPLTAQCKKKGRAWLCPIAVFGCIVFFTIFCCFIYNVKKK